MNLGPGPFTKVVWADQNVIAGDGETGIAYSQTVEAGDVRVRMVRFTPGYQANHWCSKGHVVFVLEGSLTTVLEDGRSFETLAGDSFQVGENDGQHRVFTETGAKVFIVD